MHYHVNNFKNSNHVKLLNFWRVVLLKFECKISKKSGALTCTHKKGTIVVDKVDLSKVEKQLKKIPKEIIVRLIKWIHTVEEFSLYEARKVKGYHDESLQGIRQGQRSVRLGIKWRAIYTQSQAGVINIVMIEEVTLHDYRKK